VISITRTACWGQGQTVWRWFSELRIKSWV